MKKLLFLLMTLLFISACNLDLSAVTGRYAYTFEKGFEEILALDQKYNGSFYDESIDPGNLYNSSLFPPVQGRILVPFENINTFIADLDLLKEEISQMKTTSHTAALIEFIEFRKKMLNMQRYYRLGEAQKEYLIAGPKGSQIITIRNFKCSEATKIVQTAEYYDISAKLGKEASDMLDDILTYNQEDPDIPAIVDPENHRPKFFDSPYWPMIKVMNSNANRVKQLCYNK